MADHVNQNLRENSAKVTSLIADEKYWDMDDDTFELTLNVDGASALLAIVEKEDKDKTIKEFLVKLFRS